MTYVKLIIGVGDRNLLMGTKYNIYNSPYKKWTRIARTINIGDGGSTGEVCSSLNELTWKWVVVTYQIKEG